MRIPLILHPIIDAFIFFTNYLFTIMRYKLLSLCAGLLLAGVFFTSCNKDSGLTNPTLPMKAGGGGGTANPAIAYINSTTSGGHTYSTIGVMDTTGANAMDIVTASFNTIQGKFAHTSWNYSGSSITYGTYETSSWAINAVDVSVNSQGKPVGSNVRTIYSLAASDSIRILTGPAWCATSSTGEIAFTRLHTDQADYGVTDLCTISQSGGTPTVLASFKKLKGTVCLGLYEYPTWNSDDSKIAVLRQDTNNHYTIVIFNASTGAALDSIPVSSACRDLEWSRSGTDELVYSNSNGSAYVISYVTPSTGSTPSTNSIAGTYPTWSPNNSGIMFRPASGAMEKLVPYTTSTTTVGSSSYSDLNWKR